jgi:NAD(P)-dependent dehydrogenase (short-subunit alcohol dehydrogenase family)
MPGGARAGHCGTCHDEDDELTVPASPISASTLAGKTVLITGAARGIGRAIAQRAAQAGAVLILGDLDTDELAQTARELSGQGAQVLAQACDVRKPQDLESLLANGVRRFAHPDMVFANAGIEGHLCAPWDYTDEDFMRVLDVNVAGIWRTLKVTLPVMVERGSGSVVATSSAAGLVGAAGLAAYVASKHGVVGLVRSVAASVAKSGVRVNALCPGLVGTSMLDRLAAQEPAIRDAFLALTPMGRLAQLEEIAAAALWLASSDAGYVTGTALSVDGGYTCQ